MGIIIFACVHSMHNSSTRPPKTYHIKSEPFYLLYKDTGLLQGGGHVACDAQGKDINKLHP